MQAHLSYGSDDYGKLLATHSPKWHKQLIITIILSLLGLAIIWSILQSSTRMGKITEAIQDFETCRQHVDDQWWENESKRQINEMTGSQSTT